MMQDMATIQKDLQAFRAGTKKEDDLWLYRNATTEALWKIVENTRSPRGRELALAILRERS